MREEFNWGSGPFENREMQEFFITKQDLKDFTYSPNTAWGGGNINELKSFIEGLSENFNLALKDIEELGKNDKIACVGRLWSPWAKADNYPEYAALAPIYSAAELVDLEELKGFFPIEATAGQLSRCIRSVIAAKEKGYELDMVDVDVCWGFAVPSVPLAFNIYKWLEKLPKVAFCYLELDEEENPVYRTEVVEETDPENLEEIMRDRASKSQLWALWFTFFASDSKSIKEIFTSWAITNSIKRWKELRKWEIKESFYKKIFSWKVVEKVKEEVSWFFQCRYKLRNNKWEILNLMARNEYIQVYDEKENTIVAAPYIINLLHNWEPLQTHFVEEGYDIDIVVYKPKSMIDHENDLEKWIDIWQNYFDKEFEKWKWPINYNFKKIFE